MRRSVHPSSVAEEVLRLQRQTRRLTRTVVVLALGLGVLLASGFAGRAAPDGSSLRTAVLGSDSVLVLRGVRIVDASGITRVRLGAPLPGPVVGGQERRRAAPISGMVILDGDGEERGGFSTADGPGDRSEAFIGLDSREGQTTLFLANPHDGGNLQVWDQRGNSVGLFAVKGVPYIRVQRGSRTLFEVPRADTTDTLHR